MVITLLIFMHLREIFKIQHIHGSNFFLTNELFLLLLLLLQYYFRKFYYYCIVHVIGKGN